MPGDYGVAKTPEKFVWFDLKRRGNCTPFASLYWTPTTKHSPECEAAHSQLMCERLLRQSALD
jgi:hypothetical protein